MKAGQDRAIECSSWKRRSRRPYTAKTRNWVIQQGPVKTALAPPYGQVSSTKMCHRCDEASREQQADSDDSLRAGNELRECLGLVIEGKQTGNLVTEPLILKCAPTQTQILWLTNIRWERDAFSGKDSQTGRTGRPTGHERHSTSAQRAQWVDIRLTLAP